MSASVYLDHNATSPIRPEALAAVQAALETGGNPASVHAAGRRAHALLEDARRTLAGAVGADAEAVTFTSGATEAINLALHGMSAAGGARHVFVSAIEHDAVLETVRAMDVTATLIPVSADGVADAAWLRERLARWDAAEGPPAVALMLANNEIGVLQPVAEIADAVRDAGGYLLVDAVQALGRVDIDLSLLGADYLTLSAHKLGGPAGVGALITGPRAPQSRALHGGGQERGRRGGTPNLAGAAGFAAAVDAALRDQAEMPRLAGLRDGMETRLRAARPDVRIFGENAPRLANTSCIGLAGFSSELQVMALDMDGVAVSAGAACSSGKVRASHVLTAMGFSDALAGGAIRISVGWTTRPADIDSFVEAWTRAAARACPVAA